MKQTVSQIYFENEKRDILGEDYDEIGDQFPYPAELDPEDKECQYCSSPGTKEWAGCPICEDCLWEQENDQDEDDEETDFEYMSHSDADPGL